MESSVSGFAARCIYAAIPTGRVSHGPRVVVTVLHTMERRRVVVNSVRASFFFRSCQLSAVSGQPDASDKETIARESINSRKTFEQEPTEETEQK